MLTQPCFTVPGPVCLPATEQWDIRSRAGRSYRIFLAWPEMPPPRGGWDVVYLLDGNAWFGTLVDSLRMQMRRPDVTGVRPAVVVGIGYPTDDAIDVDRRRYDLTPVLSSADGTREDRSVGGADTFLGFLADELGPMVDARFGLHAPRRGLFGHSLGGLFVLHTLLQRPEAFAAYVAASPSIWFDECRMLRLAAETRLAPAPPLLITVGEFEQPSSVAGSRAEPVDRAMIDNARRLAEYLGGTEGAGLNARVHVFPGENHVSVVPAAISRALPFLLARPALPR